MVENVLIGLDVVPFAAHLNLNAPSTHSAQLGSIDLLKKSEVMIQTDLFGGTYGPKRIAPTGELNEVPSVNGLDLCVMNPPFTRSMGGKRKRNDAEETSTIAE